MDNDNANPTTEADGGKHVSETREEWVESRETTETTVPADGDDQPSGGVTIPDDDDVEPGDDEQPESPTGDQDDPDDEPVENPELGDDERARRLGK